MQTLTVIPHNKTEWARLAQAAYAAGAHGTGDAYTAAINCDELPIREYDFLASGYRSWLVFGVMPLINTVRS